MKRFLLLFAVLLLALTSAHSQIRGKDGLTVNGIALGDTQAQVVRKLGKPSRVTEEAADECIGGQMRTLYYPGLKVRVYGIENRYTVGDFEVTSSMWNVSGVKVGMSSAAITKRFGKASSSEIENGTRIWYYHFDVESPGNSNFYFRNGKVVRIYSMYLMC
jgi:hypothetical protein